MPTKPAEAAAAVTTAEQEATEAEALVGALEERVRDGDDSVTVEEIAGARELGRFARLRAEAARRKADKARTAARLDAAQQIHDEIQQHAETAGPQFAELLQAAHDACTAFVTAMGERDDKLADWTRRMQLLNVPGHTGPGAPAAEHGRVAYNDTTSQVIAGGRRLQREDAGRWLSAMVSAVAVENRLTTVSAPVSFDQADPYGALTRLDAEHTVPEGVHWYRNRSGAVMYRLQPWDAAELRHLGLVEISRKEALA